MTVDTVDLLYRPVYAFRYRHAGKEAVIEFDGFTGDARAGGDTFEQYLGKVLDHDSSLTRVSRPRIVVQHGVKQVIEHRKHDV